MVMNLNVALEMDDGGWALPGGWAEIGLSLKENVEKEVAEESGYAVHADRLIAVLDTNFWLATHVTCITVGYSAGMLAALLGSVYAPTASLTTRWWLWFSPPAWWQHSTLLA